MRSDETGAHSRRALLAGGLLVSGPDARLGLKTRQLLSSIHGNTSHTHHLTSGYGRAKRTRAGRFLSFNHGRVAGTTAKHPCVISLLNWPPAASSLPAIRLTADRREPGSVARWHKTGQRGHSRVSIGDPSGGWPPLCFSGGGGGSVVPEPAPRLDAPRVFPSIPLLCSAGTGRGQGRGSDIVAVHAGAAWRGRRGDSVLAGKEAG